MKQSLAAKMCAAVLMGVLLGGYIHSDYVRWGSRGREVFMVHQVQRFDHYMAVPQPIAITLLSSIIATVGALAIYEAVAFVFSMILNGSRGTGPVS